MSSDPGWISFELQSSPNRRPDTRPIAKCTFPNVYSLFLFAIHSLHEP